MREDGVTLIELVVSLSIIAILTIALGFSFQGWMGNYRIENQTKELYTDLMEARTRAMTRNRMHFVVMTQNNYQLYQDTNDNNAANPGSGDNPIPEFANPKPLRYSLGWQGTITFDTRGLSSSAAAITIPLNLPAEATPDYDCIVVYQSRIRTGKMAGSTCNVK